MSLHVDLFCTRVCVYGSLRVCKEAFARGCKALHTHLRVHGRAKVCKKIVARGCGNLHSWVCSGGSVCSVQRAACKAVCAHGGVSVSKGGLARGSGFVCTWPCARSSLHVDTWHVSMHGVFAQLSASACVCLCMRMGVCRRCAQACASTTGV